MDHRQCCLLLLNNFVEFRQVQAVLGEAGIDSAAFSILHKPRDGDDEDRFVRLTRIGGIICQGSFFYRLSSRAQSTALVDAADREIGNEPDMVDEPTGLAAALYEIGVPKSRHGIYEDSLIRDRILIISHGSEEMVRRVCHLLEGIGSFEPMIYLR